jgi:hypothetical protein
MQIGGGRGDRNAGGTARITAIAISDAGMRNAMLPVLAVTLSGSVADAGTTSVRGPGQNFSASR